MTGVDCVAVILFIPVGAQKEIMIYIHLPQDCSPSLYLSAANSFFFLTSFLDYHKYF